VNCYRTTYHRNGTVTYWSVYSQVWRRRASLISAADLAAMPEPERSRISRAMARLLAAHVLERSRHTARA
jgi:hypothetical protein